MSGFNRYPPPPWSLTFREPVKDQFLTGELMSLHPGAEDQISIEPDSGLYFLPRQISIACFKAAGDRVAVPLERLPVRLTSAYIMGCSQIPCGSKRLIGIPDEEPDPEEDSPPESDEDDEFVFRHITPVKVDWAVFRQYTLGADLKLQFENICECIVHVFVRVDGEMLYEYQSWSPP